jgi:hypothetical protein
MPIALREMASQNVLFWRKRCQSQSFTDVKSLMELRELIKDCVTIASNCKSSWSGLPCLEAKELLAVGNAEAR